MKYAKISALVPQGEHYDESAIVGEGGWMTVGHLDNIESALVQNESSLAAANQALEAAQNAQQTAEQNLTNANNTVSTLQARVAELEKGSSAPVVIPGEKKEDAFTGTANAWDKYKTSADDEMQKRKQMAQ